MSNHKYMKKNYTPFFHILCNQKGALQLLAAAALAVLALAYAGYQSDLPGKLDQYRQYAHDVASEHPENADPEGLKHALEGMRDTLKPSKPYHSAWDPSAWVEYLLYGHVIDCVEKGVNTPTPSRGPGAAGEPGQAAACGISANPLNAHPGDWISVTAIIPKAFQGDIGRVDVQAVGCGVDEYLTAIRKTGGTSGFSIPNSAKSGKVVVYLKAFLAQGGAKACFASTVVTVRNECKGKMCGGECIPQDATCCDSIGWCEAGYTCCEDHCCPSGAPCCGTGCCTRGTLCVDGEHCCPPGYYWCTRLHKC